MKHINTRLTKEKSGSAYYRCSAKTRNQQIDAQLKYNEPTAKGVNNTKKNQQ